MDTPFLALLLQLGTLLFTSQPAASLPPSTPVLSPATVPLPAATPHATITRDPVTSALTIDIRQKGKYPWDTAISFPSTSPIRRGDVLLMTARMRALSSKAESGNATIGFIFEQASPPHNKSLTVAIPARVGQDWQLIQLPFVAQADFAPGQAQAAFHLAYAVQSLELADISVQNFHNTLAKSDLPMTRLSYPGQQPDAPWRVEALARIDKFRKADVHIQVQTATGAPIPAATVELRQQTSDYVFGSTVAVDLLLANTTDADRYRAYIKQHYNRVVIENHLKWPIWLQHRDRALAALRWLTSNGIQVRGHCMVWPSWRYVPKFLQDLKDDPAALKSTVLAHITDISAATRGQLTDWDVVNEPYSQRDLLDLLGDNILIDWFCHAAAHNPGTPLYINDFPLLSGGEHFDHYKRTIQLLISSGAPLGGIGVQCHYESNPPSPQEVLRGLDDLATFNLPILATEFDVETHDEAFQADYLRDHMIAFFSHPATTGIMMWGFWEGSHWKPMAALYRRDWSPKPAAHAWEDLVHRQWRTNNTLTTNASGIAATRAFLGQYTLTVRDAEGNTLASETATVPKAGLHHTITLR
jgi:GH35 family endo-1,4-beta-xylanase